MIIMKKIRNLVAGVLVFLLTAMQTARAADFLWDTGTTGYIAKFTAVDGTTTNALAAAAVVASTTVCTSGVCSQSNTGSGIWGYLQFTSGTFQASCTAGANIAGWFLSAVDGSTYESASAAPARAPDFIIPLPTGATAGTFNSSLVQVPPFSFKILIQNNCTASGGGGTFSANTSNVFTLSTVAVKY